MMLVTNDRNVYMKKLLLSFAILFFLTGQAHSFGVFNGSSKSIPRITYPSNGECIVAIFEAETGENREEDFFNAIQEKLEQGYAAKSGIKVGNNVKRGQQDLYIDLFKKNCGTEYKEWIELFLLAIGVILLIVLIFIKSFVRKN